MKTAAPTDFRLVNPEMFTTFVEVSFHKLPTNISNDMMKKLIFSAALLLAGGAVAAQPKVLAAEKIVRELKKYKVLERTDIIAFSINACLAFKKLLPDTRIYYLNGDLPPKSIKKLGLAGIDYSMGVLRKHPQWVKEAHELGLEVNVWTVDSEEDMKYFIGLGVDYITTDYPERLQALLKK